MAFWFAVLFFIFGWSVEGLDNSTRHPSFPANEAFGEWVQQQTIGPSGDAHTLARGLELARARELEMRSLLETDPQEFGRKAMSQTERASLPAAIQALVEHRIKGRGSFSAVCVFPTVDGQAPGATNSPRAGYAFEATVSGKRYRAFVYGAWKNQQTVAEADIDGIALGDALVLGDSPTPNEQISSGALVTAYTPTTAGPNTLLYMVARFSDQVLYPIDNATVLSQMSVVSNFWINCSGGKVYIKGLAYPTQVVDIVQITLPQPSSYASTYNNNFAQLLSDARTAAAAQGYNYANYNLDVVVTTSAGFSYAGLSYIGAQGSHWVTPYTTLRTAGHELGHNLGLYHANYWRTDSTQPFGEDSNPGGYVVDSVEGEWIEYGHYFSVMSAQYGGEWDDATKPIYNPAEKVQLGWLSGSQVQYVTTSGTYRLFRHDAESTVGSPRGIRIEVPATDYTGYGHRYWLQYRYAPWNTAQNWYRNGVEVDVAETSYGADGSIELDMTPFSNDQSSPFYNPSSPPGNWWTIDNSDKIDGALLLGRSYDDTPAGIHITPIANGSNGTGEEYLDVAINLGTFSSDHPPVINSFTASTNQIAAGQAVNFSVSATDPDGDALAYSWSFDDAPTTFTTSGLNSATASKSWSSAGQYRVVATVSDMKGGQITASTIITVGQPANAGEIWGRVIWGGQPVYGARVSTTVGGTVSQTWTETDGSYVLTDLPTNSSYSVACAAAGLTFTPQFTNPVPLNSGAAYGIDFYANQPLPTGGGTTFVLSGQVTDPVNAALGVEVRGGGIVTTTDSSGNYQLTNLLNGTYTVVPTNAFWTFSPVNRNVAINSASSTGNNFSRLAPYSISGSFTNIPTSNGSTAPTVYLSNGRSVTATKTTGGNKYWIYTINNVPAGQYSVTAELPSYRLTPSGFSNPLTVAGTLSGVNFTGASASTAGAITGRITQYGLPLVGVTVSALQSSSAMGSASTDSDGWYRIENLTNGAYTLSPSLSGYSFSPGSIGVASIPSWGNNFAAFGPKSPPSITSVTANPSVVPGIASTTTLSAVASGSGPLSYSWDALVAAGPVSYTGNDSSAASSSSVSFQAPGSYTFRARVVDTNGFASIQTVNVTVSAGPGAMVVAPYEVQVPGGQNASFHVDAWDQLGNRITLSPSWSVSGGGTISSSGLFSAVTPGGPYVVTATSGSLSAIGSVWVTPSTQVIPAITWTTPAGISYGMALGPNQLNASSPVAGSFSYNPPVGTVLNAGTAQTLSAVFHPSDATTYATVATNVGINVSKALLTVTAANTNKVFAAPLPVFTAVYAGFTNGDSIAKLTAMPSLTTTATPGSQVGNYPIHPSGGSATNYSFQLVDGSLAITPATPLLSWTNPAPIAYGTPLSGIQLNASATVPGSFAYTPASGVVLNSGTNTLVAVFSPTDALDYTSATGTVSLAVFFFFNGINLSDPLQAVADQDDDTLSNLAEYALGTNPLNPADGQNAVLLSAANYLGAQHVTLSFKRRRDNTAFPIQYIPEVSSDRQTWFSDPSHVQQLSATQLDSVFDWVTVMDLTASSSSAPRFVRMRVLEN